MSTEVRNIYFATGEAVLTLIAAPEVGEAWEDPSELPDFTVGGLVGHLARAITQVEVYLDGEVPEGEAIAAGQYFAALEGLADPESKLNIGVVERGESAARAGQNAIAEEAAAALARLRIRLADEPGDRRLAVIGGAVMVLDQYLCTRLVEMTVHIDDLSLSVGVPALNVPPEAYILAIGTLVQTASVRHGSIAVLRALARRERDPERVLRVL